MLMNSFTPPQRFYQTPEVEILSIAIEGSFCQSNIKDYPNNPIIEEPDDE